MERDLQALLPPPAAAYDACDKQAGRVSSLSLVRYKTNDYSVPVAYGYREENLALQAEVLGLRELVDLYRERMADADWRYQELLEQLKTMTKALPAAQGTAPRPKRWWWPFR